MSTVKIADLDLTDAIEASAQHNFPDFDELEPLHRQQFRQHILEAVLPVLPYVIKQVGKDAEDAGFNRGWGEAVFAEGKSNPYEELDPTNPLDF